MIGIHWRDGEYSSFDLETSGVSSENDRIVTATVLNVGAYEPGQRRTTRSRSWLVNPGVEIPEGATKVHGISTEKAREEGMDPAVAVAEIRDALLAAWDSGGPVVIYNAPFDLTMLNAELMRYGHAPLADPLPPVVDPLVCDKFNDPFRKGSRKLIDVAKHYGITLTDEEAHTSEGDCLATARLAYMVASPNAGVSVRAGRGRFEDRKGVIHGMSLADLHGMQVEWSELQKRGFAAFKARTSKEEADRILAEIGWPVRPLIPVRAGDAALP